MDLQDCFLHDGQLLCLVGHMMYFLFFGSAPLQSLTVWFFDFVKKLFVSTVFIFDVGVGSSIGEITFSTLAFEITTLRILAFPPLVFWVLGATIHTLIKNYEQMLIFILLFNPIFPTDSEIKWASRLHLLVS